MLFILLNSSDTCYLSDVCSFPDIVSDDGFHVNKMETVCSHVGLRSWVSFSCHS